MTKFLLETLSSSSSFAMNALKVSVIIPVYNRAEALTKCLSALEMQSLPRSLFEVLVVDNGSSEDLSAIKIEFPLVKFLYEEMPGSYRARNTGVKEARGEILAFTDSDCIPQKDWLQAGLRAIESDSCCGLVGGEITIFTSRKKISSPEAYDSLLYFDQRLFLKQYRFAATANMFTHKSIFEKVGGFDEKLKSGGDVIYGNQVADQGYSLLYSPQADVLHPAIQGWRKILQRERRRQGGWYFCSLRWRKYSFFLLLKESFGQFASLLNEATRMLHYRKQKALSFSTIPPLLFLLCLIHLAYVYERARLYLFGAEALR